MRNEAKRRGLAAKASLLGRAHENTRKLALLYAISAGLEAARVEAKAATWATRFVRHQTDRMLFMTHLHVSVNDVHAAKQDILRLLENAPGHELSRNQLTRMTRSLRPREREDLLTDLENGNQIVIQRTLTGGRPKELIRLRRRK